MKLLVTGASGFIGRHLTRMAAERGDDVYTLSRQTPPGVGRHISVADYRPRTLAEALRGLRFDAVVHLTGAGSAPADRNILTLTRVNAILPGVIVEAARQCHARAVVLAGSYAEYADPAEQVLLTERHPLEDSDPYGSSKAAGTIFALAQGAFYDVPVAVGRLFNIYGPGDTLSHRIFPSLVNRLKIGQAVPLSAGTQSRDFVHVKDAGSALLFMASALYRGALPSAVYNVATGTPCTIESFARKTAQAMGAPESLLHFGALPPRTVPDAAFMVGDPGLLRAYGWQASYALDAGLKASVGDMA